MVDQHLIIFFHYNSLSAILFFHHGSIVAVILIAILSFSSHHHILGYCSLFLYLSIKIWFFLPLFQTYTPQPTKEQ